MSKIYHSYSLSLASRWYNSKCVMKLNCCMRFCTISGVDRVPEVGDTVVLSALHRPGLKGFLAGDRGTVLQHDKGDPKLCYQVKHLISGDTPWFGAGDIVLLDPTAPPPRPVEPESNACCGSQCPNCVWIQYFEACRLYDLRMAKT